MSGYDQLSPAEIGRKAWKSASRAAKHMSKHSRIVNPSLEKCIPRFERSEVILGQFLGSGGFNDVYEVKKISLVSNLEDAEHAQKIASPLQQEHRGFIAKHVFRESSQNCRYAMKFLSMDTIGDPGRFCTGAADLVVVSQGFTVLAWFKLRHVDACFLLAQRSNTHIHTSSFLSLQTLL
jgi:serine/threonine protein kinase